MSLFAMNPCRQEELEHQAKNGLFPSGDHKIRPDLPQRSIGSVDVLADENGSDTLESPVFLIIRKRGAVLQPKRLDMKKSRRIGNWKGLCCNGLKVTYRRK